MTPHTVRFKAAILILTSALVLIGCTAIRSTRHSGSDTASGLAYYLPNGKIKLTVVREVITPPKTQVAPGRVEKVTTISTTTSGFQPVPAPLQTNSDGTIRLDPASNRTLTNTITETRTITNDSAAVAAEETARETARAQKPRTNILIGVDVELSPDRNQRYLLEMKPSAFADDFMKLRVTNGLLESVILTNTDQSLNALNNLALAAIEFAKIAAQFSAAGADAETVRTTNSFLFNPFDSAARADITGELKKLDVTINLDDFEQSISIPTRTNTPGIFYRPLQPYQLSWSSASGAGTASVYLPNASPILTLDVSRASFVSQSWVVGMSQGIPYEVVLNKPSQVAAVSMFPLNLAKSLASLPTNLIQLKIDIANRQTELIKAQNAHITNLLQLLHNQQAFDQWLATNSASQGGQPLQQPSGGQ